MTKEALKVTKQFLCWFCHVLHRLLNHVAISDTKSEGKLSIEDLKQEMKVTDEQLDSRVEEADLPDLAACFDNTDDYVEKLGLTPGQQSDVKTARGTQAGMKIVLQCWRRRNPIDATFRALLLILLSLLKGDVAVQVCKYLSKKGDITSA